MRKLWVLFIVIGLGVARADDGAGSGSGSGAGSDEHPQEEAGSGSGSGSGSAEEPKHEEHHEAPSAAVTEEHHVAPATEDLDDDDEPDAENPTTDPYDDDGDGVIEPEEKELEAEDKAAFADIPDDVDEAALEAREKDPASELRPSMSVEAFQKVVRLTKKIVLAKMEKKIAIKAGQKMAKFSYLIFGFSLLGILLLAMPLALKKKYPGQGALLFKYSGLAAIVFFVTVNMFGGVIYGFRTVQGELSNYTNPATAIAAGTFDTLDENADYFITMGKELFAPTLDQMKQHPGEQPGVLILQNGMKVVKDAKVFLSIAKLFKKIDWLLAILPIILMGVTLLLFILALRPTLTEIVKLPAMAAAGNANAGTDVMKGSMKRVVGELKATICTIGILIVLTLVSGVILGQIVKPAVTALLEYFALAVSYLQYAHGASSGLVFLTLFAVILFLVFNLASLILSMAFFLGKSQKIFQARFNEGTPIGNHMRFWKWGVPSVLLVQLFPLGFVIVAQKVLAAFESGRDGILDADQVSWTKIMLAGPIFLVGGFLVMFWAVRGVKAIKFLATYPVKPKKPKT